MPHLPPDWLGHLESGVSNRLAACDAEGRPEICRALTSRELAYGRIEVLLAADVGAGVIAAVQATRRVRARHRASRHEPDAAPEGARCRGRADQPEHMDLVVRCRQRIGAALEPYGYDDQALRRVVYDVDLYSLGSIGYADPRTGAEVPLADARLAPVPRAHDASTSPAAGEALRVRHYARDHSVFVGDEYLIRGVAGAILAKVIRHRIATGIDTFSTRELRLAGDDLRLPEVRDNLGVRLLLLERRLAERDVGLALERVGRGRYRLLARGPLEISSGV